MISKNTFKLWKVQFILGLALLCISAPSLVFAQANQAQLDGAQKPTWLFQFTGTVNSNLEKRDSGADTFGSAYSLFGQKSFFKGTNTGFLAFMNKDLKGEREENIGDGFIFTNFRGPRIFNSVNTLTLARVILPTGDLSREDTKRRFGLYLGEQLTTTGKNIGLKNLLVIYRVWGVYNNHEFKTSLSGISNNQYQLSNRILFIYNVGANWSFMFDNIYSRGWSYDGNTRDTFSFDQSIAYMINGTFSLLLGHSNFGNALDPNGRDSGVSLFNERSSSVYTGLTVTF